MAKSESESHKKRARAAGSNLDNHDVRRRKPRPGLPVLSRHLDGVKRREAAALRALIGQIASNFVQTPPVVLIPIKISPDPLIENRPAFVEFYVWNHSGEDISDCWIRATISPKHSISDYPGLFEFPFNSLRDQTTLLGAITFILPRADLGNVITLELCRFGEIPEGGEFPPIEVLATGVLEFDVAARFSVDLFGIHIRDTASRHEDTVMVSLNGVESDGNALIAQWFDNNDLGDRNNTSRGGIPPGLRAVGPFDLLPNDSKAVAVAVVIANNGHGSDEEEARKALKVVSHVGAVVATTVMSIIFPFGAAVWAGLSAAVDALHGAILDYAFADCDTVVLADGIACTADRLFLNTLDAADSKSEAFPAEWVLREKKKAGVMIMDWLGGGCRDSDYSAVFRLNRHRTPEMFHNSGSDGVSMAAGQVLSFGPITNFVPTAVEFGCLYEGKVQPDGKYKAPNTIGDRRYDVVQWTVYRGFPEIGVQEVFRDFAIVIFD